jgi:predicted membrane protein
VPFENVFFKFGVCVFFVFLVEVALAQILCFFCVCGVFFWCARVLAFVFFLCFFRVFFVFFLCFQIDFDPQTQKKHDFDIFSSTNKTRKKHKKNTNGTQSRHTHKHKKNTTKTGPEKTVTELTDPTSVLP